MRRSTLVGAGLLALLALPASAATVVATYTGTVFNSSDQTGVFGGDPSDPGYDPAALDGQAFELSYTFDTDVGERTTVPGSFDQLVGGSQNGEPSPGSAALTINGVTQVVEGGADFNAFIEPESYSLLAQDESFVVDAQGNTVGTSGRIGASFFDFSGSLVPDLENPFVIDDFDALVATGSFSFLDFTCDAAAETCTDTRVAFGSLAFDTLAVTVDGGDDPSPVPLPASVPLLASSLAALAILRRRKSA